MNGSILLDTNIILGYLKNDSAVIDLLESPAIGHIYTSVFVRMELLSFHGITPFEEQIILDILSPITIVPCNYAIESIAIQLRRATRCKLPDALVAASAMFVDATLVTYDKGILSADFPGLKVKSPSDE